MSWTQKPLLLPPKSRGSYLVTDTIVSALPEIREYKVGLLNLFVQHTSCALSLNENWDEDVRADMSDALDRIAPEDAKGKGLYRHSAEGKDDMPVSVLFCFFEGEGGLLWSASKRLLRRGRREAERDADAMMAWERRGGEYRGNEGI